MGWVIEFSGLEGIKGIEINEILKVMHDNKAKSTIRVVVWDIDFRFKKEMIQIWRTSIPR